MCLSSHWAPGQNGRVCVYLVVAPEPGQAIWVHDAEDFTVGVLPADVVLVPAV